MTCQTMFSGKNKKKIILTVISENSADDKLMTFFYHFSQKTVWHFMQLSPMERICMKCQTLFL